MLRPPLEIGPVSVFLLILSGLKFHMKGKMTLLTSLAKSVGVRCNAASRKSLEIQGYSITKPRTLLKRNLYEN